MNADLIAATKNGRTDGIKWATAHSATRKVPKFNRGCCGWCDAYVLAFTTAAAGRKVTP